MTSTPTGLEVHPALARLADRTVATNFEIRDYNRGRRGYWLARRRRMAAEIGLRVDRRGRLRNADDSTDDEL